MEGNDRGEGPSGHLSHGRLLDVTKIEHDFRYPPFQEFDFNRVNQADLHSGSVTNWDAGDGTRPQDISSQNLSPKAMKDET
jgi:hypothetical protein